jgi:hypothetical protein
VSSSRSRGSAPPLVRDAQIPLAHSWDSLRRESQATTVTEGGQLRRPGGAAMLRAFKGVCLRRPLHDDFGTGPHSQLQIGTLA